MIVVDEKEIETSPYPQCIMAIIILKAEQLTDMADGSEANRIVITMKNLHLLRVARAKPLTFVLYLTGRADAVLRCELSFIRDFCKFEIILAGNIAIHAFPVMASNRTHTYLLIIVTFDACAHSSTSELKKDEQLGV
jgi:hypothetical protein